jgi:hypothetical protein
MAASCSGGVVRRYGPEMAEMLHGASGQTLLRRPGGGWLPILDAISLGGAWSEILGCACSVGLALRDSVFGSIYSPKTLSRRGVSSLCKRRRNSTVVTSLGGPTPLRSRRDCAHGGHLILGSVFWFRSLRNTIFCEESECRRPGPRLLRCLLLAAGEHFDTLCE